MGPSTLATLFSHRWPRFCGGDIYSRRKPSFSSFGEHTAVCGSSVRQAVARPRHRQSVCIHNIHVALVCSGPPQCAATCGWTKWPVCSGPNSLQSLHSFKPLLCLAKTPYIYIYIYICKNFISQERLFVLYHRQCSCLLHQERIVGYSFACTSKSLCFISCRYIKRLFLFISLVLYIRHFPFSISLTTQDKLMTTCTINFTD